MFINIFHLLYSSPKYNGTRKSNIVLEIPFWCVYGKEGLRVAVRIKRHFVINTKNKLLCNQDCHWKALNYHTVQFALLS
jgi:hypothetical protein